MEQLGEPHPFPYPGQYEFEGIPLMAAYQTPDLVQQTLQFKICPTDVLLMGYPKTGTTWLQELLWLICNEADTVKARQTPVKQRVPNLEIRFARQPGGVELGEALSHPRILKSHLPVKYWVERIEAVRPKVVVIMRNPKDTMVSYYHFIRTVDPALEPMTWNQYFDNIRLGNVIYGDCLEFTRDWWNLYHDNDGVLFLKYEDMKADIVGNITRIATFLGKSLDEEQMKRIVHGTSFDNMKRNMATNRQEIAGINQKVSPFYRKGQVGDWKTLFTEEQNKYVDREIKNKLSSTGLTFRYE